MPAPQSPNQGFLDTCIGVIFNPVPTMRTVVRRRPVGWALILIIAISGAQGLTAAASLDPADFDNVDWLQGPFQAFSIVVGPALAVAGVAFFTAICWIMSRILGGRGSYGGLFAGFGFAYLPAVLTVPISVMALQLNPFGQVLSGMIGFGVAVWTIVLSVFAVKANNSFSTGRALIATLIPLVILIVLLQTFIVFLLLVVVIVSNEGFT